MWELEGSYYVLIGEASINLTDQELTNLVSWFDESCRIIGTPVKIVKALPIGSVSVPARSSSQLSQYHGVPFTTPEFNKLLKTLLSKDFPRFGVYSDHGGIKLVVESAITTEQHAEVDITLANLGFDVEAEIIVKPSAWTEDNGANTFIKNDAVNTLPTALRLALEEDEDFWVDSRLSLFAEGSIDRHRFLESILAEEVCSCFVNSTALIPENLRGYLTLYKIVWIALPLAASTEAVFKGFNVNESELLELAARGRDFDEGPFAEFCGSIMTGVKQESIIAPVCDMSTLIEGLLCLDNDAPIIEVAEVFDGSDMLSLQKLIQENSVSNVDLSEYVKSLNGKVKRFERNQNKVRQLDLVGLAGGFATIASTSGIASYVPIGAWVLQKIFMQSDSFVHGPVLDWIRAKAYMTTEDVVLVSRLRKKMD